MERMQTWLANVATLTVKELRSLLSEKGLILVICFMFSIATYSIATGISVEVKNASVGVIDHDNSTLSHRIESAIAPPYFQPPMVVNVREAQAAMDRSDYVFILDIPPNFEEDVLAGRHPDIQLQIDATAVAQAGVGSLYLQQIIQQETYTYLQKPDPLEMMPVEVVINRWFNPNGQSVWFMATIHIVTSIFMLSMMLVGAAVIREKERGTIEHLLVMLVTASEIAFGKIISNSIIIALTALLAMILVLQGWLGVPVNGSLTLFMFGTFVFLFSSSALGIMLATAAPTLPQFALLALPLYVVLRLFSGADSPFESMPDWLQQVSVYSPMTQYAQFSSDVLFRAASLPLVYPYLIKMALMGMVFLFIALKQFKGMLDKQG